jgi:hypothetical protein
MLENSDVDEVGLLSSPKSSLEDAAILVFLDLCKRNKRNKKHTYFKISQVKFWILHLQTQPKDNFINLLISYCMAYLLHILG